MKIIKVDNFARETVSDVLIAENVSSIWGERIVKLLNEEFSGDHSSIYFRLVGDIYKLYEYEP